MSARIDRLFDRTLPIRPTERKLTDPERELVYDGHFLETIDLDTSERTRFRMDKINYLTKRLAEKAAQTSDEAVRTAVEHDIARLQLRAGVIGDAAVKERATRVQRYATRTRVVAGLATVSAIGIAFVSALPDSWGVQPVDAHETESTEICQQITSQELLDRSLEEHAQGVGSFAIECGTESGQKIQISVALSK